MEDLSIRKVDIDSCLLDWKRFTKELVVTLNCLEENEYLIIAIKNLNGFVQFAAQGASGMRIEATSNDYLSEDKQLDEKSQRLMLELGWQMPTHWPEEDDNEPEGSPNYYLDVAPPVPLAHMAELAVKTLRYVFDVQHPDALRYDAFTESGEPLKFPNLGIDPDPSNRIEV